MSDTVSSPTNALMATAAMAIDGLPGVTRIESTLANALRRLRVARTAAAPPEAPVAYSSADGIQLSRRGDLVDLHVDISATTLQPATTTAQSVRDILLATIAAYHLIPGSVTVTVIKLEARPEPERP